MAWYRKYRPTQISKLHLEDIKKTFSTMMKHGNITQVMLFAGPKGTGKTSASRIIGALLNDPQNETLVDHKYFGGKKSRQKSFQEPDDQSELAQKVYRGESYIVQEMDAASHRGIDDVRALRERVMLPPTEGKVAVFILDEAHMLTTEAFNALLKLLEEPPPHVVFILATTELHKIPATVASRCTVVDFPRATMAEITQALTEILKTEKISCEDNALNLITERADGSFRDAVKMLELAASSGELTQKSVEELIAGSLTTNIKTLLTATLAKDPVEVCQLVEQLRQQNTNYQYFLQTLFNFLHLTLMQNLGIKPGEPFTSQEIAHFLLTKLQQAELQAGSPIPFLPLELALLELIYRAQKQNGGSKAKKTNKSEEKSRSGRNKSASKTTKTDKPSTTATVKPNGRASKALLDQWDDFVTEVAKQNATLAALLRSAKPISGLDGTAKVGVYYRFHQEQLQQPRFLNLIEACGQQVAGDTVKFEFVLQEAPEQTEVLEPKKNDQLTALAEEVLM